MIVGVQLLLLALLFAAPRLPGGVHALPTALAPWGLVLMAAAIVLILEAKRDLRESFRVHPAPGANARLVRDGIYARLRHPMYVAAILFVVGFALRSGDAYSVAAAALNVVFYALKARFEERLLSARYPDYAAYRREARGVFLRRG